MMMPGVGTCWIKDSQFICLFTVLQYHLLHLLFLRRLFVNWRVIRIILLIRLLKEKVISFVLLLFLSILVLFIYYSRSLEWAHARFNAFFLTTFSIKEGVIIRAFFILFFFLDLILRSYVLHYSF